MAQKTLTQSHQVAQQAAGAHSAALAKLMQGLQQMQPPGGGAPGPQTAAPATDPDQDGDNDLPDPQTLVQQDPMAAASYAEAIMQALAELLLNTGMAPQGAPMTQAQPGPDVGGGSGPAY